MRAYRAERAEHITSVRAAYDERHAERISAQRRQFRAENRERLAETQREWAERHPDYGRTHYAANRETRLAAARKWYHDNRDRARANYQEWAAAHPEAARERAATRRARKLNATVEPLPKEWRRLLLEFYDYRCLVPGCVQGAEHIDHVVPLAKGGTHGMSNFQTLCARHNLEKATKIVDYRNGNVFAPRG